MPAECRSYKIRIMMEYDKLQRWGDSTGLADVSRHKAYDRKMKVNAALTEAILSEIQSELKTLSRAALETHELKLDEKELFEDSAEGRFPAGKGTDITASAANIESGGMPSRPKYSQKAIEDVDLTKYRKVLDSPYIPPEKRKHVKGFNGVAHMTKGVKAIFKNPKKRMMWAVKDRSMIDACVNRLEKLTRHLYEMVEETQMRILIEKTDETWLVMLQMQDTLSGMETLLEAMQADRTSRSNGEESIYSSQANTLAASESTRLSQASTLVGSTTSSIQQGYPQTQPQAFYERLTFFSIAAARQLDNQESCAGGDLETFRQTLIISQMDLNFSQPSEQALDQGSRTFASYKGHKVWIEWKPYRPIRPPRSQEQPNPQLGPDPFILKNVERLVSLLQISHRPEEFCVPDCKGYFIEQGKTPRFGIVYSLKDQTTDPTSLFSLLQKKPPTLHQRVKIAQKLARSLMYLHAVNWLHKGLRSTNILFAAPGTDPSNLYISGLEYARPDEVGLTNTAPVEDLSWGEYSHPGYLGTQNRQKGYRKTYDIYSLGIILLEIGHWKPAEVILGFRPNDAKEEHIGTETRANEQSPLVSKGNSRDGNGCLPKSQPNLSKVCERLLEGEENDSNPLEDIKCTMGERYYSALRACLVGMDAFGLNDDLPQSDPQIAALLQQAYLRVVVDVLESISI